MFGLVMLVGVTAYRLRVRVRRRPWLRKAVGAWEAPGAGDGSEGRGMSAVTEPRPVRRLPPAAAAAAAAAATAPASVGGVRARQPKVIHSGLTVLEEVTRLGAGITVQEISQSPGLPRVPTYSWSTCLRRTITSRTDAGPCRFCARKVVELAHLVAPSPPLQAVRDMIAGLRSRIRGGIYLVRYEGERILIVDADPGFPLSDESRIPRDLSASAMRRLMLANWAGRASPSGYASQTAELTPG